MDIERNTARAYEVHREGRTTCRFAPLDALCSEGWYLYTATPMSQRARLKQDDKATGLRQLIQLIRDAAHEAEDGGDFTRWVQQLLDTEIGSWEVESGVPR